MEDITVDQMTKEEVLVCLEWAKAEGWNPGLHDADVFYETDLKGFFAARRNGEMVGGISIVSYSSGFKFGGLLIVRPDIRNKGVGRLLISHMLQYSAGFNLGCDGVLQMAKKYESYGFIPAHENIRYVGKCVPNPSTGPGLVPISSVPLSLLTEYDARMFPSEREKFLRLWTNQPDSFGLAFYEKGQIKGYGIIRRCHAGLKVGPLFADDEVIAGDLLSALVSKFPDEGFNLDVPMANRLAFDLALRFGMKGEFRTLRMYTREAPTIEMEHVFGITSFELG